MTPRAQNTLGCPDAMSGNCVTWDYQDIPCIGLCNGQSVSQVMYNIGLKVCQIAQGLDLSQLDLSCLTQLCGDCPEQKDLFNVLQYLLNNQCTLLQLIDNLQSSSSDTSGDPVVNMKCLTVYDAFNNALAQDTDQVFQSLINASCTQAGQITTLQSTTQNLQSQITALQTSTATAPEVQVSTCIATALPVSQALVRVANDYCGYKTVIGTSAALQQAISQQCANMNSFMGTVPGWVMTPQTVSDSFGNLWLAYCNALSRIQAIENNCCAITCKDITIGFTTVVNQQGTGVSLVFSEPAGTDIPNGFTDGGSMLTLTDNLGAFYTYNLTIAQGATVGDFSFVGLSTSGPINISVNAVLTNGTLTCEKCISKLFSPVSTCPVCAVTGTGGSGAYVTILYQTF